MPHLPLFVRNQKATEQREGSRSSLYWRSGLRTAMPLAAAGIALLAPLVARAASPQAARLVREALVAQGGQQALLEIGSVRLRSMVVSNALEQSVRREGPYFQNFEDQTETRRFDRPALLVEGRARGYAGPWYAGRCWTPRVSLVTEGVALALRSGGYFAQSQASVSVAEESLALGPERVLLTALAADDLRLAKREVFHGYVHDVVTFSWHGAPIRLFLQPTSHMPVAVEIVRDRPMDTFWSGWGDVTTRTEWDAWTTEVNGVRYPRRWTISGNGLIRRSVMIDDVTFNVPAGDAVLGAPSAAILQARASARTIAAIPFTPAEKLEVAPGITLFTGRWNVVQVDQPGGTYVLEGPISTNYSAGVLAEIRRQGLRPVGVISTSDSWPHIAGLREYVAEKIPVVALDLNLPLLRRMFTSPHSRNPDALARRPRAAVLRSISAPVTIGSGVTAMRLVPLRTVTGERQMLVYWPARRLLYTSDILSLQGDTVWLPQYRDEVASVIEREHLDVDTVFGMHYPPTPWSKLASATSPTGKLDGCAPI